MSEINTTRWSESMKRLNPQYITGHAAVYPTSAADKIQREVIDNTLRAGKRLRQNSGPKLNKTEAAFGEWLAEHQPGAKVYAQGLTFLLGNGVRYTPDYIVRTYEEDSLGKITSLQITAYEVKGFMRDDAAVKIKVAASLYSWVTFKLVWRTSRTAPWQFQEILT